MTSVDDVPDGILLHIFMLVRSGHCYRFYWCLQVCRRWRDVAWASGVLWSKLHVGRLTPQTWQKYIQYSKEALLDVRIGSFHPTYFRELALQMHRIQRLTMTLNCRDWPQFLAVMKHHPARVLEVLALYGQANWDSWMQELSNDIFCGSCPRLEELHLSHILLPPRDSCCPAISNIKKLIYTHASTSYNNPFNRQHVFSHCPLLTSLSVISTNKSYQYYKRYSIRSPTSLFVSRLSMGFSPMDSQCYSDQITSLKCAHAEGIETLRLWVPPASCPNTLPLSRQSSIFDLSAPISATIKRSVRTNYRVSLLDGSGRTIEVLGLSFNALRSVIHWYGEKIGSLTIPERTLVESNWLPHVPHLRSLTITMLTASQLNSQQYYGKTFRFDDLGIFSNGSDNTRLSFRELKTVTFQFYRPFPLSDGGYQHYVSAQKMGEHPFVTEMGLRVSAFDIAWYLRGAFSAASLKNVHVELVGLQIHEPEQSIALRDLLACVGSVSRRDTWPSEMTWNEPAAMSEYSWHFVPFD